MTLAQMLATQTPMVQDGGHMMGLHWGWWGFWIVVLMLLLWGVGRGLGRGGSQGGETTSGASAEETLRRRFAKGEIDEEEYRRRLEALRDRT